MILSFALILPDPEHSPLMRAVLVLGYLVAALCWLKAGLRTRTASEKLSGRWWLLGAFLLFLLAANKAFDFRSQCELFIRLIAKADGWYDRRQPVQFLLAVLLPVVAGLFALLLVLTRGAPICPGSSARAARLVSAAALPRLAPVSGMETSLRLACRHPI